MLASGRKGYLMGVVYVVCMVWYDESVWCDVDGKMGSVDSETGVILLMEMMN